MKKRKKKLRPTNNETDMSEFVTEIEPVQDDRIIFFEGFIKDVSPVLSHLYELNRYDFDAMNNGQELVPLKIFINSEGGSTIVGINIYSHLKNMFTRVITIGSGEITSIASLIFLSGKIRIVYPSSFMMVHNCLTNSLTGNSKDLRQTLEYMDNTDEFILNQYVQHSLEEYDTDYWIRRIQNEKYFIGKEIFDIGFANVYISPEGISVHDELSQEIIEKGNIIL